MAILLAYPEVPVNGQHLIEIYFSEPPRNFRITDRSDRLMAHWFVEPTELRLRVFCGLDPLNGGTARKWCWNGIAAVKPCLAGVKTRKHSEEDDNHNISRRSGVASNRSGRFGSRYRCALYGFKHSSEANPLS